MVVEQIIIIGGVGTALNIAEQINSAFLSYNNPQQVIGFCFDTIPVGNRINNIPVVCDTTNILQYLNENNDIRVIFNLFRPDLLKKRFELLNSFGIARSKFTSFVHPSSYIAESSKLGIGNVILSCSTIQSNVIISDFNIINSNVTIEHDTRFGEANFIAANVVIGANVKVGSYCFFGLNVSIRECVVLNRVYIGMHSLVLRDFEDCVVYGSPATVK